MTKTYIHTNYTANGDDFGFSKMVIDPNKPITNLLEEKPKGNL